jgi:hypothetical protein
MRDTANVTLDQHDAGEAGELADDLADLFQAVYSEHASEPFSREQFLERLTRYRAAPGYTLITAREDGRLVGFLYGYPLAAGSRWCTARRVHRGNRHSHVRRQRHGGLR